MARASGFERFAVSRKLRRLHKSKMIEPLQIKPCLHESIDLMESLFSANEQSNNQQVDDFLAIKYTPKASVLLDQSQLVWKMTVRRKMTVVWFMRTNQTVLTLAWILCKQADVLPENLCSGDLSDSDFERLNETCGHLAGSPLQLFDAKEPEQLKSMLRLLSRKNEAVSVLCDWQLADDELELAEDIASRSRITFLCPRDFY